MAEENLRGALSLTPACQNLRPHLIGQKKNKISGGKKKFFKKFSGIEHADPHETHILCILSEGAKTALGYSIYSPLERVFSFNISNEDMRLFSRACEEYILNQLGHSFKSLEFYKSVMR